MINVLDIYKEYYKDLEREQDRKSHTEKSFLESYFIGIRCPDDGEPCASLAKEYE